MRGGERLVGPAWHLGGKAAVRPSDATAGVATKALDCVELSTRQTRRHTGFAPETL
eukprot:SAG22_NODE_181_length_16048_cov_157.464418_2_plen_56_part_00